LLVDSGKVEEEEPPAEDPLKQKMTAVYKRYGGEEDKNAKMVFVVQQGTTTTLYLVAISMYTAEELYQLACGKTSVKEEEWPAYDEWYEIPWDTVKLVVQVPNII
jgi:leucyl-tRNA synthetase